MFVNKPMVLLFGVLFIFAFSSGMAYSDEITFSRNLVERFSYKDWVAYKTDSGHCRPTTEFLIGGTVATLAILRRSSSNRSAHTWLHLYGEYINSLVELRLDGELIRWRDLEEKAIERLANAQTLFVTAILYTELPPQVSTQDIVQIPKTEHEAMISLAGSSASLRFCNFID